MTLNRWIGRLDDFRNSAISQAWLNSHNNLFQAARNAGIKLELRYAYSYNPPPSPPDASAERIIQHINQLGPIWEANADVICSIQAGFVGRWGEWNASGFGITSGSNPTTRNQIIQALVNNVPTDRMISLRYPEMGVEYLGGTISPVNVPPTTPFEERFTGTPRSRLGILVDSFLANPTDGGTYVIDRWASNWGSSRYAPSWNFFQGQAQYSVASGETVDGASWGWNYEAGDDSIAEMERLSWDILNRAYSTRVIVGQEATPTRPRFDGWLWTGHYPEISRRLGYRLGLTEVTLPTDIVRGTSFNITFTMHNDGFGKVFNPRPIDLVLTPTGGGGNVTLRLTADARRDLPLGGETVAMSYNVTLPGNVATGNYNVSLRLPDPYPSIASDNRYSIRLANTGDMWNGNTGHNSLGMQVAVSAS